MKKLSLILLITSLSVVCACAQNGDTVYLSQKDTARIFKTFNELNTFKRSVNDSLKNKFESYQVETDRQMNPIYIGSMVIILLAGLGVFGYFSFIKKYINRKITERIENIVDEKQDQIISLIRNYELEAVLKKNKKILFLSENQQEKDKIRRFFSKFDFENLKSLIISDFEDVRSNKKIKKSDVVVINNINEAIADENLLILLNAFPEYKNSFIYYGTFNPKLGGVKNLNFANSEFTLYSRILETLKTQNILSER